MWWRFVTLALLEMSTKTLTMSAKEMWVSHTDLKTCKQKFQVGGAIKCQLFCWSRHVSLWSGWLLKPFLTGFTLHKVMFGLLGFFFGRSFPWVNLISITYFTYIVSILHLSHQLFHNLFRGISLSGSQHRWVLLQETERRHKDETSRIRHQWNVSANFKQQQNES